MSARTKAIAWQTARSAGSEEGIAYSVRVTIVIPKVLSALSYWVITLDLLLVAAHAVEPAAERLHNREQVLDHFLLRRERFLIGHDDFAAILTREMSRQIESKAGKPVLVRDKHSRDLPALNALDHRQKA